MPFVVSVNVGAIRRVTYHGQVRETGIWKEPVEGRVAIIATGLAGDRQADLVAHGGVDKAVYVYASEDAEWWEAQLGAPVPPGTFGENVTVSGVDINAASIGDRWRVGTALLEVVQPRFPCWKLGLRMGDSRFPKRFLEARRPGAYTRVVEVGDVAAGDSVSIAQRSQLAVTIGEVAALNDTDRPRAVALLASIRAGDAVVV